MPSVETHINPVIDSDAGGSPTGPGRNSNSCAKLSVPDRVAQIYYKHGLLCSTYSWGTILLAIIIVLTSCYPLLSLPFPGNEPEEIAVFANIQNNQDKTELFESNQVQQPSTSTSLPGYQYPSRWRTRQPAFYIQQVIIRSTVHPWTSDLGLIDAFRGPLGEIFQIHHEVIGFHSAKSNQTLRDVCVFVEGVAPSARPFQHLLPEFSCLVLSPAKFWLVDQNVFKEDATFLDTIFAYKNTVEVRSSSVAELLFGVPLKDSGLKKYPVKTRSRIITYALTLVLKSHPGGLLDELRSKLHNLYPLYSNSESSDWRRRPIVHIYYPERFNYLELIPLTFVYFILFLYIYFSVRKIELVKSKLGMAFSAVVTVIASLGMSVGLCAWFGLRFTLQGRDVFPYLVVIIGLENILVLTRSVVSTPANLDVKIRVAQGLSREGWNITKNLLTEVTILTVGFFTFVPAIQEFCLFAVVALLSDFILQMLFFATVLSIDILRMELSEIQRQRRQLQPGQQYNHTVMVNSDRMAFVANPGHPHLRPRAHMSMTNTKTTSHGPTAIVAPSYNNTPTSLVKVPRRLKIVHFWARTRFFQRTFMIGVVIWMGIFFYKYVVVEHFSPNPWSSSVNVSYPKACSSNCIPSKETVTSKDDPTPHVDSITNKQGTEASADGDLSRLQHPNVELWRRLSYRHWPDLLALYNFSLAGSSIALLPPIRLSISVHPNRVNDVRNVKDSEYLSQSRWKSLATALDSLDVLDGEDSDFGTAKSGRLTGGGIGEGSREEDAPFVPSSPVEIILTTLFAIPSVAFIFYVTYVMYRCICSRHYAEWRSNWWDNSGVLTQEYYSQIVVESMPLVLDGHRSPVECISADGDVVSSVCLAGQLRFWDVQTGDVIAQLDRSAYFKSFQSSPDRMESSVVNQTDNHLFKFSTCSTAENVELYHGSNQNIQTSSPIPFTSISSPLSSPLSPPSSSSPDANGMLQWNTSRNTHLPVKPSVSPVWCMQCFDGLVALGCANGRIEVWSSSTLKCLYDDGSGVGVAKLKASGEHLLAARLNGVLESFHVDLTNSSASRPRPLYQHRRTESDSENWTSSLPFSESSYPMHQWEAPVTLVRLGWTRAHQQPISMLDCEGGRVVTGSHDHCIKVWKLDTLTAMYSLHGHCGPITALFIDSAFPSASGSGSQDGMLCLWDLSSGTCVYSLQAHDGSVAVLTYTSSYVISLGSDDKLCVWERFQGHLLHTLHMYKSSCCGSMAMLNDRLLVTSRQGSLVVWDVRTGEPIRVVRLGDADNSTFVRHIVVIRDNVICDYGTQLRVVSFPMISTQKME